MTITEIFAHYHNPARSCNCDICLRARWHQAVDLDETVPDEVKVVLRWYWDKVEALETERDMKELLVKEQKQ